MSVDKIIGFIKDFPEDDKALDTLQTELSSKDKVELLSKNADKLIGALGLLSSQKHTLGLIHLLAAIVTQAKYDKNIVIKHAHDLIINGSIRQIRFDPKRFALVCRKYVEACRELKQPMRAIKPMKIAINKIAPADHLTPQHALLCLACISAKCYKAALPILNQFVFLIDPKLTGIGSEDTRLYYYYGGICYTALKEWEKATEFFEIVLSAPAMMPSAIMVEAYKKFILVSLIHKGEPGSVPKCANMSLVRVFKQFCTAYDELTTAFSTHSVEDVAKSIENNLEPFTKDSNLGLVGQVKSALIEQNIRRMTLVYLTATFSGLKENTGLKDAQAIESKILKMAETTNFSTKINTQKGYVTFGDSELAYDNDSTVNYLRKHIHDTVSIHKQFSHIDREIEKSDKFVQKTIMSERLGDREGMGDARAF
jgi:COP9 signalosome complex subunit 3